jgi:hypothetical protein
MLKLLLVQLIVSSDSTFGWADGRKSSPASNTISNMEKGDGSFPLTKL